MKLYLTDDSSKVMLHRDIKRHEFTDVRNGTADWCSPTPELMADVRSLLVEGIRMDRVVEAVAKEPPVPEPRKNNVIPFRKPK
jgi:hypothetical protein